MIDRPALKALMYFHSVRDCRWWLHGSPASPKAFRDVAHGPPRTVTA